MNTATPVSLPVTLNGGSVVNLVSKNLAAADANALVHVANSLIFRNWADNLDPRFGATEIELQLVDYKGAPSAEKVMFVRMQVKTTFCPKFPQIIQLRGDAVTFGVILECEGQQYTVLVVQPRIATSNFALVEMPAGMVDNGTVLGAVVKEMEEELGLTFTAADFTDLAASLPLAAGGIYASPGLLDEKFRVFVTKRTVTRAELDEIQGKATGLADEGETISLKVIPLGELLRHTADGKAFIFYALYSSATDLGW